jgi:hypothetical protein
MTDEAHAIERAAMDLIKIFGNRAAHFVREHAKVAAALPNQSSTKKWHDIANAIERL